MTVSDNLTSVKNRINAAAKRAGRSSSEIRLIAVTKEASLDQIREAADLGVLDVGENRVNEALEKKNILDSRVLNWHMIGHLQSNKVKQAVRMFSLIHSVDSLDLARIIDKEAKKNDKIQDVLIEVNASQEKSKFGINPESLGKFLEEAVHLKHIKVLGLMTMAPITGDADTVRPYFKKVKELSMEHDLKELSMGMTQDFEVAIEEGATMVRIGSAIFRGVK